MTNLIKIKTFSLNKKVDNDTFKKDIDELQSKANSSPTSPSMRGGNSVSGSTPLPKSDDDTLQNAHQMGIAPNSDLEHPTELNLAKDIKSAEEYRKTH